MTQRTYVAATVGASVIALVAAALIRAFAQPAPAHYFASDQPAYLSMAMHPFTNTPETYPPASWRVLPPLVARAIGDVTGLGSQQGFLILTFACFMLMPVAAVWFLGALGHLDDTSLICAVVVALAPTVVGYLAWDVIRVDALSLLLLFVASTAVVQGRRWMLWSVLVALSLTKETALIAAAFALAWAILVDRSMVIPALIGIVLTIVTRSTVIPWLVADPKPFSNLGGMQGMIDSLSTRYVLRRVLLATASTWNLLLLLAAVAIARSGADRRMLALLAAAAVAFAQTIFASDTQRLVAAAYPFMLAVCAVELDRQPPARRRLIGAALVVGQIPWLLEYGRVVHIRGIRGIEIGLFLLALALFTLTWYTKRFPRGKLRYI